MPIKTPIIKQFVHSAWADVAVLMAGAAMPFAFAPYDLSGLAVVALALLFLSWLVASPRRAALRGLLFGLGMFGVGVSWVNISIHGFGGVPLPLSLLLTSSLVFYLALYPAALGYVSARFFPGATAFATRIKLMWAMPAGWVGAELLRGWMFTGFPWLSVGYSQIDSPLRGYAPLFGVYGVSWSVAATAGLLLLTIFCRRMGHRAAYLAFAAALWGVGDLLTKAQWTQAEGESLKVSLLQGNISQDLKWTPDMKEPTLELYTDLTRQNWDSDLIVWPETAWPDFYHRDEELIDALAVEARANRTDLLMGVLTMDLDSGRYYNSMVSVGSQSDVYSKRHLVPFTEYLPLKSVLGSIVDFMDVPMSDFSAGDSRKHHLYAAGQTVGMSICFEDVFGEELRLAAPEATLLVNVSNDAWFADSAAPHQHLQIARMRALETGRPLLRGTNTGISAIIDADGRITATGPQFQVAVVSDIVQPRAGVTPYAGSGNYPVIDALLAVLFLSLLVIKRGEEESPLAEASERD